MTNLVQFSSVQLLSHVRLFATPWTAARQASLSITNSWSLLKLLSIDVCDMSGAVCLCDVYVRGLHMGGDPPAALGRSPSGQVPSPHPQSGPSGHTEHTEL